MTYSKPYLTYEQQLSLIVSRGVACADEATAIRLLRAVGYYNFTGYLYPYRLPHPSGVGRLDQVRPGTDFSQVEALISFDRQLRSDLLQGIQIVEVGMRALIAYVLGKRDPFGHLNLASLDKNATQREYPRGGVTDTAFNWWQTEYVRLQRQAAKEDYVAHNLSQYGPPLPIWIACEFLDFGAMSNLYPLLCYDDRAHIARVVGLDKERTVRGWLTSLNYLRNVCAHNQRLWNRVLTVKPGLQDRELPNELRDLAMMTNEKVYPSIAIAVYLVNTLNPDTGWIQRIHSLLQQFPVESGRISEEMGMPRNWEERDIWASCLSKTLRKDRA